MSRLTIDMTDQQHQALKAMAALEGKTIKQFTLERLFANAAEGSSELEPIRAFLAERLAQAERGELAEGQISEIADKALRSAKRD